jgi:hypothetical protein
MNVRSLRSSNLRLIPGLEFAPLRHEEQPRRQPLASLFEETPPQLDVPARRSAPDVGPPLPSYTPEDSSMTHDPHGIAAEIAPSIESVRPEQYLMTPLEELARRLEAARMPAVEEPERRAPTFEPSIVSDTFANILVAQGAYSEALKAFQTLARTKPERYEHYSARIEEMKRLIEESGK